MYEFHSRLESWCDFRQIPLEGLIAPFQPDTRQIEADICRLQKKYAPMTVGEQVAAGDFVDLGCQSENPKFNKPAVTLTVGKNLFSQALEQAIVGMSAGSEQTVQVEGIPVTVCIRSIQRRVLLPLTDPVVAGWELENIHSLKDLQADLQARQKQAWREEMQQGLALYLSLEECKRSRFQLDAQEVAWVQADSRRFARELLQNGGFDPDTVTDAQVLENCGRTRREHFDFVESLGLEELKTALIGLAMMQADGVSVTQSDYEAALAEQMEYFGRDRAQAEQQFSPFAFCKQYAANYHYDRVEEYAAQYLDKENAI